MRALDRLRLQSWRDPERQLRRVQRQFWATPQQSLRIKPRRERHRPLNVAVTSALAAGVLYLGVSYADPSLPGAALDHVSNSLTYYANCDAARAAGVAPIYRGEPGYRSQLDRDDDGIACEPRRR